MLSNLDQILDFPVEMLFAFPTNNYLNKVDVGRVLKQSLSKVLEVYYPLAGRLKAVGGKIVVDCNVDEGVPFAQTFPDEDMAAAAADITMIDRKLATKLAFNNDDTVLDGTVPLAIQVNRFRCGGMILGLRFNHVIFDGTGLADFMKSWSEIARGLPLSNKPHMDRSILSPRKHPKSDHLSKLEISSVTPPPIHHKAEKMIVNKSFIFSPTMLSRLRGVAMQNNERVILDPTTFELISALTWICWTRANKLGPDETSRIGTAVDVRHKLEPPMPKGYFGNCIVTPVAQSRARDLTLLSYAVGTVHDAFKAAVTGDYIRSTIDSVEITRKPLNRDNILWFSKWTRLSFYDIDFGWGVASQVAPGAMVQNFAFSLSHGKDSKNLVLSVTLHVDAMELFQELITSHLH